MNSLKIFLRITFDIYLIKQHFFPFILSFFVYTFVLLMNRLFELVDLIFGKGLNPIVVGHVFLLSLPFIIAITAPMAFLTSVIAVFGRMSEDFEIIAFKALGISHIRILLPMTLYALVFAFFMVFFNNNILPESNHKVKVLLMEISSRKPLTEITPRSFINNFPGYTLYSRAINKSADPEILEDVLLISNNDDEKREIILATSSSISIDNQWGIVSFRMLNGQQHIFKVDSGYWKSEFGEQIINIILPIEARPDTAFRGDRELNSEEMFSKVYYWEKISDSISLLIDSLQKNQIEDNNLIESLKMQKKMAVGEINRYLVEIHKKYSLPFAAITFIFLGIPLGLKIKKGGMGAAFGIAILITTIYYVFIVGGETLSDRGVITPFFAMWGANIVFFIIGIWMYFSYFQDSWKIFTK